MDSDLDIVLGTAVASLSYFFSSLATVSANRERTIRGSGAEDGCSRACVDFGARWHDLAREPACGPWQPKSAGFGCTDAR